MLTLAAIKKTLSSTPQKETWVADIPHLYLRFQRQQWHWYIRMRDDGRRVVLKLAPGHTDVRQVRNLAHERIADVRAGRLVERQAAKANQGKTVADLRALHAQHALKLSDGTQRNYRILWDRHILARLSGRTRLSVVTTQTVMRLHRAIGEVSVYNANRSLEVLIKAFTLARQAGWLDVNPAEVVDAFTEKKRQTILDGGQIAQLMAACDRWNGSAVALPYLVKLLLFTGLRCGEWTHRRWREVQGDVVYLPTSKTGERWHVLPGAAVDCLAQLRDLGLSDEWVIPSTDTTKPMRWPHEHWVVLRQQAGLPADFRLHDLRHTAGSYAHNVAGLSQREVADFLGHRSLQSVARYVGTVDKSRKTVAERVDGMYKVN